MTSINAYYGKHNTIITRTIKITTVCVINNHLVIVTVDIIFIKTKVVTVGYYYGVQHQLKLDAKCELEDEAITMILLKRFQHFWHQIKAVIVTIVMVQFTFQIMEIVEFYKRIEFIYNTICNNVNNIMRFDTQQSNKMKKALATMQYDFDAANNVFSFYNIYTFLFAVFSFV